MVDLLSEEGESRAASSGARPMSLEVLMQLGENRIQAMNWINMALADEKDRPADVTALIERCFRIKAGS